MPDAKAIAVEFIRHFGKGWPEDFDFLDRYLAQDGYYQMVAPTIAPVRGREAIRQALEAMKRKVPDQKHDIVNVAASERVVFTERVDQSFRDGKWVAVPLIAVFELNEEGRIVAWREYLDLFHNMKQHGISFDEIEKTIAA
ncbi:limonene-1,2-epoxide hydrolase family protein [Pseudomonas lopnurensis]|uniref:limonene-1,2-epoxide hydrolase family protein n=1 Tax=Pseudomonas lopnurensis TaxID=1477517 RepID=UPI0028A8E91F|nr:limonene-1,2-epoxide hydrolase family protein [Pseudomonas lopnurensis]